MNVFGFLFSPVGLIFRLLVSWGCYWTSHKKRSVKYTRSPACTSVRLLYFSVISHPRCCGHPHTVSAFVPLQSFFFFCAPRFVGSQFSNQGSNLCPLQWNCSLNLWTTRAVPSVFSSNKNVHALSVSYCFALLDSWNYFSCFLSTAFMFSTNTSVTVTD